MSDVRSETGRGGIVYRAFRGRLTFNDNADSHRTQMEISKEISLQQFDIQHLICAVDFVFYIRNHGNGFKLLNDVLFHTQCILSA